MRDRPPAAEVVMSSRAAYPSNGVREEKPMGKALIVLTMGCLIALGLGSVAPLTRAADEPVTVVSRFYPTPGREDELEARFLKSVAYVRKAEPQVLTYRVHRSVNEPVVFLWYEVYPSQAEFEHHKAVVAAFRKEFGPLPEGIVTRPPETEVFRALTD
jgi:quinol monooxygenase YgiN